MKKQTQELSRRYLAALRAHLGNKSPGSGDRAQGLGRTALAVGLGTRELALMHEQAMIALPFVRNSVNSRQSSLRRASFFLSQAFAPLEAAQHTTREVNRQLRQRNETLRRHTAALAAGNRQLKREVVRRKAGEEAVKKGKEHYQLLFVQSQFMQKKLRHLAHQILSAQEDERREISRELHDEVVQTLVGINVQLAALGQAASIGLGPLRAKIAHTQRLVEKSVSAVHRFARELRPAVLDDLGLIPALHAYTKIVAARKKLKIRLTAFAGVETLNHARRTVLYRVAQEALTNVTRHAQASLVDMSISRIPGAVRLEIHDNGKSFQVLQTLSAKTNRRLGLVGMRERVEMVGGTLIIESAPGRGTTVCADVPFGERGAA